jgi:hypothetical protein
MVHPEGHVAQNKLSWRVAPLEHVVHPEGHVAKRNSRGEWHPWCTWCDLKGTVITEISSAQGDKELRIVSTEKQSFMAQGLTPQHIKRAKTIQSWLKRLKSASRPW